jgi:hypothetical protein
MMNATDLFNRVLQPHCPKGYVATNSGIKRKVPKRNAELSGRQRTKIRKAEHRYCAALVEMAAQAQ